MERTDVLWFGSRKGRADDAAFKLLDLNLVIVDQPELTPEELSTARALVLFFGDDTITSTANFARTNGINALEHGLTIYVLANDGVVLNHACNELDEAGIKPYVTGLGDPQAAPDREIAKYLMRLDPSKAPLLTLDIKAEISADRLPQADELLIRRAFADCEQIRLVELGGGRTADTYMVEALFAGASSRVGPRPLPFFVKLGKREEIAKEVANYRDYATNFIPFHLRPNLDMRRCVSGSTRGILVGDLVERATPFWQAAVKGEAHTAVHSLFDLTLAGWRAQGFQRSFGKRQGSVAAGLAGRFNLKRVKDEAVAAARDLGLTRPPKELWEALLECDQCYYHAPMHGDLHPGNIFVRGSDAILIDLASIQDGPLSGDLACLEVALLFETRTDDEKLDMEDWRRAVDDFYAPEHFLQLPAPAFSTDSWSARLNCARQVRMVALPSQACPTEYMSAVAVYLLRRSMYPADNDNDASRRGYAMVVADRLVTALKDDRP